MGKSDSIVRHVCEDPSDRTASKCPWHVDRNCFFMFNNHNSARYHCIFSNQSRRWHSYGASHSCDLSEEMHDLKSLSAQLGEEHVLPFAYAFRERSGHSVAAFSLREGLRGPTVGLSSRNLAGNFYGLLVLLCAICRMLGGRSPTLKLASFLYAEDHPVLANVGASNSERKRITTLGGRNAAVVQQEDIVGVVVCKRSWNKFLREKTCKDVAGYLKRARPELFRKKRKPGEKCVLRETERFDDETHRLICGNRSEKILNVLKNFIHLAKGERLECIVRSWIREEETDRNNAEVVILTHNND